MTQYGRFYTRTRRIPVTIGKLPSGERIWGGPYTGVQAAGAVVAGALLLFTQGLWGTGTGLVDVALGVGLTYGVVVLLKRMPDSLHEIRLNASGAFRLALLPPSGTYRGRPVNVRARRPRPGRAVSAKEPSTWDLQEKAEASALETDPGRRLSGSLGDSSVSRLLRDAGQRAEND